VRETYGEGARVLAMHPLHANTILRDEARLWLNSLYRRLARQPGSRSAFRGQINDGNRTNRSAINLMP
jgi:hypothetical protein